MKFWIYLRIKRNERNIRLQNKQCQVMIAEKCIKIKSIGGCIRTNERGGDIIILLIHIPHGTLIQIKTVLIVSLTQTLPCHMILPLQVNMIG